MTRTFLSRSPILGALVIAVLAALSSACSLSGGPRFASAGPPPESRLLVVTNRAWADLAVYQLDGSTPRRLGLIPALRSGTFAIQATGGPVRFLLRPLAAEESYEPEPIWVDEGQVVELIVQPTLRASDLALRWRLRL